MDCSGLRRASGRHGGSVWDAGATELRILIDTHLLLWWFANSLLLSEQARTLISDPESTVFVSAVSLWEIRLKESLGKLRLPPDFEERFAGESFESLPLTAAQTRQVALLPWRHRDPFDRMLVAQAQVEDLTLLTADEVLTAYGDFVKLVR
ncbi:MAG: type II toxin-antitoxin system VapC family toxin [Acidobacteria bacterium]|nr:type II toxin-antitoxin system VapC family toxin [Acidobacteriota bacterium]